MGRRYGYTNAKRLKIPSVTTVIGHVEASAEGLIHWAHRLGIEGKSLEEGRQKALTVGTVTHARVEAMLKGEDIDLTKVDPEVMKESDRAYAAWNDWIVTAGMGETLASEPRLVSEALQYGGTPDAIVMLGESKPLRTLIDVKTGARLYPKDLAQIAGYGIAWDENHPDKPIERYSLLRLGKEDGAFSWLHINTMSMDPAFHAFRHARELYDYAKSLKKMVGG